MNFLKVAIVLCLTIYINLPSCKCNIFEQFQNAFDSAQSTVEKFVNDGNQVVNFVNETNNVIKGLTGWVL